jgi:hypothetical protein
MGDLHGKIFILWRTDQLLSGDCKQRPVLRNGSVNTFPLLDSSWTTTMEMECFYLVRAEML